MEKLLKTIFLWAIFICGQMFSVFSLCGCENNDPLSPVEVRGTVRMYTSLPQANADTVKTAFEKDHPEITLEITRATTGAILDRIDAEAARGQVQADVVWLADPSAAEELKAKGLLQPYDSPESAAIPPPLVDEEGYYTGSRLLNMVVGYNTNLVTNAPTSYRDLLKPEYQGIIGMASPDKSGASFYLVGSLLLNKNYGWEYFYFLHQNGCQITDDNDQLVRKLASGELAMGIVLDYAVRDVRKKNPEAAIDGVFCSDGIVSMASPVALTRDCSNASAARIFIDWLLSTRGQVCLYENASIMPVNIAVPVSEDLVRVQDIKVIPSNPHLIDKNSANISRIYHDIFAGKALEEIDVTLED